MSLAALFALTLAAAAPPDLPPPLSPDKLPAPPVPAPVAPSFGAGVPQVSVCFGPLADTPENAVRKAVAAVAKQDGFRFAEVGPDNTVTGYTATCRLAVVVMPGGDGVFFYVLAATRAGDAERTAQAIRDRIQSIAHDPKTPKTVGVKDAGLEKKLLPLAWHIETRPLDPICQHFAPAATLALAKRGYQVVPQHPAMVLGQKPAIRPTGAGELTIAGMAGGVKGISVNFVVASTGTDAEAAARDAKAVCTAIVKLLYE